MQTDHVDLGPQAASLEEDYHWCLQFETMLTPSFNIEQNDEFIIITIRVPYIKISEAEFYMNGTQFKFHCKPYFLRLHLPSQLVEDGREKAAYDVDAGTIVVHAPKLNRGEHFENLGMITTLLSKRPAKDLNKITTKPLIEVAGDSEETSVADHMEEDDFDWEVEQQLPTADEECQDCNLSLPGSAQKNMYGFTSQHSGVFAKLQEEIPSIVDCPDPDHMTSHDRRIGRIAHEETSFDPEYYLADLMDNDYIEVLLKFEPPWTAELVKLKKKQKKPNNGTALAAAQISSYSIEPDSDTIPFSAQERDQLKELPNKEYLLDKATRRILYLGLIDIIFAYAYNYRITEGENNVESAWTICKLSSTLSWLEVFQGSIHEVVYCSLRRSVCYPLYRHWQLALSVLQDTREIFRLGRRKILQCLLSVHRTLSSSELYYILNNLYITDYCVWVQRSSAKTIQKLTNELDEVTVDITTIGWELVELEYAARLVLAEEEKENSLSDEQEESTERTNDIKQELAVFSQELEGETSNGGNLRTADTTAVSQLGQTLETISLRESNQITASLGTEEVSYDDSECLVSLKLPGTASGQHGGRLPPLIEVIEAPVNVDSDNQSEESDSTSTECSKNTCTDI